MSVQAEQRVPRDYDEYAEDSAALSWLMFGGTLLLILGCLNTIEGIAAIGKAHFFVANQRYIVGDLNTWGWVVLCLGVIQLAAGFGVFVRNQLARWVGVGVLFLNAIAQLMMMPAYPLWSVCLFAIDVLAIYGMIAHGKRSAV